MSKALEQTTACLLPAEGVQSLQWTNELVQKFWDFQSRSTEAYFTSQFGSQIANAIQDFIPKKARVLDYACGTGALTGHLLHAGLSVAACDLSYESVEIVQNKFQKQPEFLGAFSIAELALKDLQFDAVVLVEVVEHIDDQVLKRIFDDVRRVLLPGGIVVVTTPNNEDLTIDTVYCPSCDHTFHRWQHVRSWSAQTLSVLFSSLGFQTITTQCTDFSLSPQHGLIRYWIRQLIRRIFKWHSPHLVGVARLLSSDKNSNFG